DIESRTGKGSYGGILESGWTSLPESWDADPRWSMQHCMLGHVMEWLQEDVGGIRLDPQVPGFQRFVIAPQVVGDLSWCRTSRRTSYGTIRCEWRRTDGRFELDLTVPVNTSASVRLPARSVDDVMEGEVAARDARGVVVEGADPRGVTLRVGSGVFHF